MEGLVDSERGLMLVRDQIDKVIWQIHMQIDVPMLQVGEIVELPHIQEHIVEVLVPHVMKDVHQAQVRWMFGSS